MFIEIGQIVIAAFIAGFGHVVLTFQQEFCGVADADFLYKFYQGAVGAPFEEPAESSGRH